MAAQLLTALYLGGYKAAPGGSVNFYQVGTTTPATVYSNDAASAVITQPVALDQNGVPVVPIYATAPLRCKVYDSTGAQLLDIERIDGVRAEAASIANASWPGETTVDAVLTALGTTLGGTDGNFLPTGTAATQRAVRTKLSELPSLKDWGAVGNGIADDTAAIVAAMTAVNAAGGGTIQVPAGTYVYSTTLTILAGVSFKGVNAASSVLSYSGASNGITMTSLTRNVFEDIGLTAATPQTTTGILATSCSYLVFSRVRVTNFRIGINLTDNGTTASTFNRMLSCEIVTDGNVAARSLLFGGTVAAAGIVTGTGGYLVLGCALGPPANGSASVVYITGTTSSVMLVGNYNNAIIVPGLAYYAKGIWIDSSHTGGRIFAIGNDFSGAGQGVQIDRATGPQFVDFGNIWNSILDSSDGNLDLFTSPAGTLPQPRPLGGAFGTQTFSGNGTFTPNLGKANFYTVKQTSGATTVTIANPVGNIYPPGGEMILILWNQSAGAVTWSFGTSYTIGAAVAPAAGLKIAITLRSDLNSSATVGSTWYEISRSAAY